MTKPSKKSIERTNLWRRNQHDSIRIGFDFETKNINTKEYGLVPWVVQWGLCLDLKNHNEKNPLWSKNYLDELKAKDAINIKKLLSLIEMAKQC